MEEEEPAPLSLNCAIEAWSVRGVGLVAFAAATKGWLVVGYLTVGRVQLLDVLDEKGQTGY